MPRGLRYENDYLVGGPARCQVTPDFALSEYAGTDGRVRIHRELVASVQVLRDRLGRSIRIAGVAPADGLGRGLEGRFLWPLRLPSLVQQVAWADALSRGRNKAGFYTRWKAALQAVGQEAVFRAEMLRYAYDTYGRKLIVALARLKGLTPIPIRRTSSAWRSAAPGRARCGSCRSWWKGC